VGSGLLGLDYREQLLVARVAKSADSRPSTANGVQSVRAYRRLIDFALDQVIAGNISCRTGKVLTEMARAGAEMLIAERHMKASGLEDCEDAAHVLGADGGLKTVKGSMSSLALQSPELIEGNAMTVPHDNHPKGHYDATQPEPDDPEVVAQFVSPDAYLSMPRRARRYSKEPKFVEVPKAVFDVNTGKLFEE